MTVVEILYPDLLSPLCPNAGLCVTGSRAKPVTTWVLASSKRLNPAEMEFNRR
jgi:hypothetical protein